MKLIYENDLSEAGKFKRFARQAEITTFLGSPALCLDGLVVFPNFELTCGLIEVEIAAEKSCYPGVAFRVQDQGNYELAYAQPHTSGQWDAIQYDPVFHGTNTWQMYHGAAYQQTAQVPTHEWIRLRVGFAENRMVFWVNEQPPCWWSIWLSQPGQAGWDCGRICQRIIATSRSGMHHSSPSSLELSPAVQTERWLSGWWKVTA